MRKRLIALLLVLALGSGIAASAFAAETADTGEESTETAESTGSEAVAQTEADGEETEIAAETENTETTPEEEPQEATADMVLFKDLEELVKKNNWSYKALQANASYAAELEDTIDKLESGIAQLDAALNNPELEETERAALTEQKSQLQQTLSSLSGGLQQDPDVTARQMDANGYQLIMGAESLFIALVGLEQQETALQRQLASVDRTLEEMTLRAEMGQISELQLMEVKSGRTSLVSGLTTLQMNIFNYKMQLEQMIGKEMTGTLVLGTLPSITEEELNSIDTEADLKKVLRKNYDIYAASASEDAVSEMGWQNPSMDDDLLESLGDAARYTYKSACQQAELKYKILYAQLQDCRQVLKAAETALECEKLAYQAEELKYQQGMISQNTLLTAEDDLKTAKEAVQTAKNDLFAAYNTYCWAVEHGILN